MAQRLVVGIFPGCDASAIDSALRAQNIDLTRVKVVGRGAGTPAAEESAIEFVEVAEELESGLSDDMTHKVGIMSDSGGTSVPGLGGSVPPLGTFSSGGAATNYLAGLPIPGDEVDNFNAAIEDGRSVVAYPNADDANAVSAAFKAAGLRNIREY